MSKPALSLSTLPELAGWLTFGEAARALNVSNERIRQMATSQGAGRLRTAHRLGKRPIGIVREAEIREIIARRTGSPPEAGEQPADASVLRPCGPTGGHQGVQLGPPRGGGRPPASSSYGPQGSLRGHVRGRRGVGVIPWHVLRSAPAGRWHMVVQLPWPLLPR
jgi:hypothetical protein